MIQIISMYMWSVCVANSAANYFYLSLWFWTLGINLNNNLCNRIIMNILIQMTVKSNRKLKPFHCSSLDEDTPITWPLTPEQHTVEVLSLLSDDVETDDADPGENLKLRLKGIEEEEILPGFILCNPDNLCHSGKTFDAQVGLVQSWALALTLKGTH